MNSRFILALLLAAATHAAEPGVVTVCWSSRV